MKFPARWIFAAACVCVAEAAQPPAAAPAQPTTSSGSQKAGSLPPPAGQQAVTDRFGGTPNTPPAAVEAGKPATMVAPILPATNNGITSLPTLNNEGYWVESAPINEVFQYLARSASKQYFFNNELAGPEYNITGHLKLDNPEKQMEDLAIAYGLTVHQQGSTTYLMTDAQLAKLPVEVMCYQLKYLRGAQPAKLTSNSSSKGGSSSASSASGAGMADFEKLKGIIKPMLTREVGQIELEEKTNVLLVTDNNVKLQKVRDLLEQIDRPKQQIVINVRILRVRNKHGSKIGVDWTNILGDGLPIKASQSLNALFNLPNSSSLIKTINQSNSLVKKFDSLLTNPETGPNTYKSTLATTDTASNGNTLAGISNYTDGAGLVFSALEMEAIVHALNDKNIVSQEACPTIITEDNEQGVISVVDRFPVITSEISNTSAGSTVTDKVRYKIDEEDPNASDEPEKSREIGVTLSVTPTLLPDGTVRMRLRPRVANITELVPGKSGNFFPRVSESTIEGISRIPNGQSLFLGGFYDANESNNDSKIPFLGSIPLFNKLFSYKDKSGEQISLVFIISPRVYDASNANDLPSVNGRVQMNSGFNRTNPNGMGTPLLPAADWQNGYLPVPDQASIEHSEDPQPPPSADGQKPVKKLTWIGRLFSKKESAATAAGAANTPPPASNR